MITSTRSIVPLRPEALADAVATTSRAFWRDPVFGYFARDPLQEHLLTPLFLEAVIRDAMANGQVFVTESGGKVTGSASWLPPGAAPVGGLRRLRMGLAASRALLTARNRLRGLRLLDEVDRAHPTDPHWYLALLGVEPSCQGQGLGSALLRPQLDRCDVDGTPAYLETQKPENVVFYGRFGFEVVGEVQFDDSPRIWRMWRDPRTV